MRSKQRVPEYVSINLADRRLLWPLNETVFVPSTCHSPFCILNYHSKCKSGIERLLDLFLDTIDRAEKWRSRRAMFKLRRNKNFGVFLFLRVWEKEDTKTKIFRERAHRFIEKISLAKVLEHSTLQSARNRHPWRTWISFIKVLWVFVQGNVLAMFREKLGCVCARDKREQCHVSNVS